MTHYSEPENKSTFISQERLKKALNDFKGTKICVLDACYQGNQYKNMKRNDSALNRKLAEVVDFLITSSAADQISNDGFYKGNKFIENGITAYYFKTAIEGEADSNRNNVLSSFELRSYFTGYARHMADQNDQDMEINCESDIERLFVIGDKYEEALLVVESNPSEAEIWINGRFYNYTPATFPKRSGDYSVMLKKNGYEEYEEFVRVSEKKNTYVWGLLEKERKKALLIMDRMKPDPYDKGFMGVLDSIKQEYDVIDFTQIKK